MPHTRYAGVPYRKRPKRPSIPRAIRRQISEANKENKKTMKRCATKLFDTFNDEIKEIAKTTGFARSVVAREALQAKTEQNRCGANLRNAWIFVRMAEVNEGKCS